ncbi:MAG: exodeoxyribonuclease III [Polyangiaceae bacterium]|nr:exodeoxyribonuclease III [Polyangiaceae bacterium]
MRIASWNVNSIRPRMEQLTSWLVRAKPDVVCLQETKVEDDKFPMGEIGEAGYQAAIFGQKTYNGVAILTRFGLSLSDVQKNLTSDEADAHKRLIAGTVDGIRIVNVYVPNGQELSAPAYQYKLDWMSRLKADLSAHMNEPLIVCGDFNVAPEAIDVHNTKKWDQSVLFHETVRARLRDVMSIGLTDSFRHFHPDAKEFSWWDYRLGAFKRNWGLRIDLALVNEALLRKIKDVSIDRTPREAERPSDHTPVVVDLLDN